ncbi:hypothetical protein NBO_52g0020 [Nosema bombycis CQ1]|uniref:Uncharacterized protein n=1 Tax=Nosema bombycis (strain CQ1 / CVCC 102059) TaxID=578461 RepID=R0M7H1_NOSB1|nr:hypothetical protein NBO_52g0020 [Nosema bombycis CQ1]|eukprot:EOB13929.1 hypothetical protein NBO_52g0020 [Nosema bombycis CQ1]
MDTFSKFDNLRKIHNFPSKTYRNALRKTGLTLENKLEIDTSKYIEFGVSSYLKKNKRLIKNNEQSPFTNLYLEYTEALLTKCCDLIVKIRNKLQNFTNFIEKLDEELSSLDFDTSTLKFKYQWHDLEILFSGEGRVKEFLNKTFIIQDTKYNTLLVKHIYNVEKKREQLEKLFKNENYRIRCIREKIKVYINSLNQFIKFLESNYVESEYLNKIKRDCESLEEAFSQGKTVDFSVPELFKNYEESIIKALNTPIKDKKKTRNQILNEFEDYFSKPIEMNIPFLPEFYDIAFDFIKFPEVTKSLEEIFTKLDLK